MGLLIFATVLVMASHVLPSIPSVRCSLMRMLGRRPYLAAHSIVSLAAVALLVWAWMATDPAPSALEPGAAANRLAVLAMPCAFVLITARLLRRPTGEAVGIYTVTAVPGSLGVLLWSLLHAAAVSDARGLVIFLGFAAIALFALVKNRLLAPAPLRAVGWFPFASALRGRTQVDWRGIGIAPILRGIAAWVALLALHPLVIGPDPLVWIRP